MSSKPSWAEMFAHDIKLVWMNDYLTYKTLEHFAATAADKYEFGTKCRDLYNVYIDQIDKALEADEFLPDAAKHMFQQAMYNPGATPFDILADELYEELRSV